MASAERSEGTESSVLSNLNDSSSWPSFDSAVSQLGETHSAEPERSRDLFKRLGSELPAPGEPGASVPATLGRFRLIREVGRGRFGIVYLARDDNLDRDVAIKVARPEVASDDEHRQRFGREAELAARLDHPLLVPVYEVGVQGPWLYIVMRFCDGDTLTEWSSEQRGTITPAQAARVTKQIADAIAYGHSHGVVHRDLKPANIGVISTAETRRDEPVNPSDVSAYSPVDPQPGDPEIRVFDFGLSCGAEMHLRDTRTSLSIGTPLYMAPEQLRGSDVTPAADVYSIGTILYELLTGTCPFEAKTQPEVLHRLWHDDPQPPSELNPVVDREIEAICLKALSKRPAERYPDASELADDLSRWLRGRPTNARPSRWWRRLRLWSERPNRVREAGAVILTQHIVLPVWTLFGQLGPQAALGTLEEGEIISPQLGWSAITHLLFFVLGYRLWRNIPSRFLMRFAFVVAFLLVPLHLGRGLGWLPTPSVWYDQNPDMRWLIFWLMSLTAGIDLIAIAIAIRSERRQRLDRQ